MLTDHSGPTGGNPSILLIRFSSLGDIILITPLVAEIKRKYPQAHLTVLIKKRYAEALAPDPLIDRLLLFDDLAEHRGLAGLIRFCGPLRSQTFDWIIDLQASQRSYFVSFILKKRNLARYRKAVWQRRLMVWTSDRTSRLHTVDKYFAALAPLGITRPEVVVPRLSIAPALEAWAGDFLRTRRKHEKLIGVNLGARWTTKQWPFEKFKALVRELARHHDVVLFGEERDQQLWQTLGPEQSLPVINTMGTLGLGRLLALIKQCQVLVTGDSGPMHAATGFQVPVVALFGPTHPGLGFAPLGDWTVVLCKDVDCSPCSLHGKRDCTQDYRICLESIDVQEVLSALATLLG